MKIRKLTELALLTAISLILFVIELRLPNLVAIPGVKLGLANIITVIAVFRYSTKETLLIVASRLLLGAFCSGNPSALLYSASGAMFCLLGMLLLRKWIPQNWTWLSSILGAILHNIGQISMAMLIMHTWTVLGYLPILLFSGCIAGAFTGLVAQLLLKRISHEKIFPSVR